MKRCWGIMLNVLLILSLIVGCSSNSTSSDDGSSEDGKVTLTFLHRWPNEPYKTFYNDVIAQFEKENPNIKIEQVTALNDDYRQKINVILGNDNPPDIFFTWVGEYGDKFIRENIALDITKYYEEDKEWSEQLMATKPFTYEGKNYGVPLYTDSKVFYYNKEMFAKHNLTPPETWTEFMDLLKTLKEKKETPILLGNKFPWAGGHYITSLNQRMVKPETLAKDNTFGESEFTDPMYIEALKKLDELQPYFNENTNSLGHEEARNFFLNGESAMIFLETFEAPFIEEAEFEWDTFKFPTVEGGEGTQSGIIGAPEGFMVSQASKHPDEAMKFLKFLTSKEIGEKLMTEAGMPSAVIGAVNENTATDMEIKLTNMIAETDDILNWLDNSVDSRVAKPYIEGVQQMHAGTATPEQVMEQVQAAAKSIKK
ncbi:ABC transporter substrate-binding protein [Metabacillus elymi]|uniref:Extracellular solute-binding protein n=1 Tax=Metabacillus elymi TaxID=2745198 RepID=A0ABX6S784_9BACI|nr:extracellular solute-binding protein [Metabacillus sp. KUDC1714]QNF29950.1 extracellular solute-binding protein [Metabacillus sp. KUDC1714]